MQFTNFNFLRTTDSDGNVHEFILSADIVNPYDECRNFWLFMEPDLFLKKGIVVIDIGYGRGILHTRLDCDNNKTLELTRVVQGQDVPIDETSLNILTEVVETILRLEIIGSQREYIQILLNEEVPNRKSINHDEGAPQGNASTQFSSVSTIINLQLTLGRRDTVIFIDDKFALGYVFGMADMAYFQRGGSLDDQDEALNSILSIFNDIFDEDGSILLKKSIQAQQSLEFDQGRKMGADEFGIWIETKGKVKPMGLTNHFQE